MNKTVDWAFRALSTLVLPAMWWAWTLGTEVAVLRATVDAQKAELTEIHGALHGDMQSAATKLRDNTTLLLARIDATDARVGSNATAVARLGGALEGLRPPQD